MGWMRACKNSKFKNGDACRGQKIIEEGSEGKRGSYRVVVLIYNCNLKH